MHCDHLQPDSSSIRPGHCTLVGAGPGDPELLTIKALKAIQAATVLLVDDLVSTGVVALASPNAQIVHVGKRGGCKSTQQDFIERLIITAVNQGEQVVRLKGGDPFIFGRGGEELDHLRAVGISVSVINGITSGLAAASSLGVPLTHRDHAHGVVFITGHAQARGEAIDWQSLAKTVHQAQLTLVIYMGIHGAAQLQRQLLLGLPENTPVAIVQHASLSQQRHALCTLEQLERTLLREHLGSPSVIVVGQVLKGLLALSTNAV